MNSGTAKDDLDFAGEEENVFLLFFMVTGFGPVVINNPYFLAINKYHELTAAKTA